MKKKSILIALSSSIIFLLAFGAIYLVFWDDEDNGKVDPCYQYFNVNSFFKRAESFGQISSYSYHSTNKNCSSFAIELGFFNLPQYDQDTTALNLAKAFFSDSSNNTIDKLDIEIKSSLPGSGNDINLYGTAYFRIFRDSTVTQNKKYESYEEVETYNILSRKDYTWSTGEKDGIGLMYEIEIKSEYKNLDSLAKSILNTDKIYIEKNKVDQIEMDIFLLKTNSSILHKKKYWYYFSKDRGNLF